MTPVPKTPIPNSEISRLGELRTRGVCLVSSRPARTGSDGPSPAGLYMPGGYSSPGMHLSGVEPVEEMQAGQHRLGEDREAMLRGFIRADCASGGRFGPTVIKEGGMIDRAALIMIADLEDLAVSCRTHCDSPAGHFLRQAGETGPIRKAGSRCCSPRSLIRNGMPVRFLVFGLGTISRYDLEAIASFSKEDSKRPWSRAGWGRNALQVFTGALRCWE